MNSISPSVYSVFQQLYSHLSWPLVVTQQPQGLVFANRAAVPHLPGIPVEATDLQVVGWAASDLELEGQSFQVWQWMQPAQAGDVKTEYSLLNNLFDKTIDSLKLIDDQGRVLQMNGQAARAMPLHLGGQWQHTPWPQWWEAASIKRTAEALERMTQGQSSRFQASKVTADGLTYWDVTLVPVQSSSGNYTTGLVLSREVTALVAKEQQLQQSLEALEKQAAEFRFVTDFMPQMVWATEPDGYHDFYNQRWYDYTGLSYEETKADGWNKVLHPADQQRAWKVWGRCLETGEAYEIEYRFRRHDGVYRWFLGRAVPMRNDAGEIVKWFGTCTDIHEAKTEQQLLENLVAERTSEIATALEKVQASNVELKQINEDLTQFAYIASHDLQEPLRKVQVFGDLAMQKFGKDQPELQRYLGTMINGAARMSQLIKDLLKYSKISGAEKHFEQVDLKKVFLQVCEDYNLLLKEKGAVVKTHPLPTVLGIPVQLHQLFSNLLSNALKFSEGRTLTIELKASQISRAQLPADLAEKLVSATHYHLIEFFDDGPGVAPEYAEKIFSMFQRLQAERVAGTGMGLTICRKIAENHQGWIVLEPSATGAHFHIYLPMTKAIAGMEKL